VAKGDGNAWTISDTPSATVANLGTSETSDYIRRPITLDAGTYEISYDISKSGVTSVAYFWEFRKDGVNVGSVSRSSLLSPTVSVTLSDECDEVLFYFGSVGLFTTQTITINEPFISLLATGPVKYSLSMTPSDESMCDKKIQFKIYTGTEETDGELDITHEDSEELFYSDFIDFVSSWANGPNSGRVDIQYRSIQNFAGLLYDSESEYFQIQLEGRFRKERKITEEKALELTEMVLNTAASVKKQRKLTIDDVPDYMHTKICLILAHAASGTVLVNGMEISKEEAYEEGERPETYPLTPAEIWLTDKNYYKHNVI